MKAPIQLYKTAKELQEGGILFNVTNLDFTDPDCVKISYGVSGQCNLWLYRNGDVNAPTVKDKNVIKYLKSQGFKI